MNEVVLATGYWCEDDEVFETEEPPDRGPCPACGCGEWTHDKVKIVMIEAGNE